MEEKGKKSSVDQVHICFSSSGRGSLKYAISKGWVEGKTVLSFSDDLSNGPIQQHEFLEKRVSWWKELYLSESADMTNYLLKDSEEFREGLQQLANEQIIIWCGANSQELCGVYYLMAQLAGKKNNITLINVSTLVFNKGKINEYTPKGVGEVSPEKLREYLSYGKTLCDSDIESLTKEWDILKKENSVLRAYDGVKIISVPVEYYDKYILSCAEADYGKCARTVGEALGKHEYLISDTLVFWRILEMIKLEQIEYKGRLGIMREMEIRKGGF